MSRSFARRHFLELSVAGLLGAGLFGLGRLVMKSRDAARQLSEV